MRVSSLRGSRHRACAHTQVFIEINIKLMKLRFRLDEKKEGINMSEKAVTSTKTHDELIKDAVRWAKSLGYDVVECHPGTKTGADAVFQNHVGEKVILEVVSRPSFKQLFRKPRIREALVQIGKYTTPPDILGLIVVSNRINNVKKHAIEVGIPANVFDPKEQKVFAVRECDFREVILVLLVSILGSRASAFARAS